jgi:hypothetical protein
LAVRTSGGYTLLRERSAAVEPAADEAPPEQPPDGETP